MPELLMHELAVRDRIALAGPLTVRTIKTIHGRIADALHHHPAITIDCSAATEVDLSFLQLMIAARKSAAAAGKTVSLARPAAGPLRDALTHAGLIAPEDAAPAADQTFWLS